MVDGSLPISFALAAYIAAVTASRAVVLEDSAAFCSVAQQFLELSLTKAVVSAATVTFGIDSVTRRCSEPVVGRPTVDDLGWTTAIELPVLPCFPLLVFALEDNIFFSQNHEQTATWRVRPQLHCQSHADAGCKTCISTAEVSCVRHW